MDLESLANELARKLRRSDCMAREAIGCVPPESVVSADELSALREHLAMRNDRLAELASYLMLMRTPEASRMSDATLAERARFAKLATLFGFHERILQLDVSPGVGAPDEASQIRVQLERARAQRGRGKYSEALQVYQTLYDEQRTRAEPLVPPGFLILQMGKTAHNHLWRTGLFWSLAEYARSLLALQRQHSASAARHYAIALDSLAFLRFELYQQDDRRPASESDVRRDCDAKWQEALEIVETIDPDQSALRMRLRRAYANFFLAPEPERDRWFAAFHQDVMHLERNAFEIRGHGVRFGQCAQLLHKRGRAALAEDYILRGLHCAEQVSDWRTYAANQLRRMELIAARSDDASEMQHAARSALLALAVLEQSHPEIEMEIHLQLYRFNRGLGRYEECRRSLEAAVNLVRVMEERMVHDNLIEVPSLIPRSSEAQRQADPPLLDIELDGTARVTARVLDYRLISGLHNRLLNELNTTAHLREKQASAQMQLHFLSHYEAGRRHWMVSLIEGWKASVMSALKTVPEAEGRINESFQLLVSRLRSRALDVKQPDQIEFVSMKRLALSIARDYPLTSFDSNLKVQWMQVAGSEVDDFQIQCQPQVVGLALVCLVENAAKMYRRRLADKDPRVWIATGWSRGPHHATKGGILQVIDDAGEFQQLQEAWPRIGTRQSGLWYTKIALQDYGGDLWPSCDELGRTCVSIFLPHSHLVHAP